MAALFSPILQLKLFSFLFSPLKLGSRILYYSNFCGFSLSKLYISDRSRWPPCGLRITVPTTAVCIMIREWFRLKLRVLGC